MTSDGKDRVIVDTGIIMAVIAYRSKSLVPVFDKAKRKDDLVISNIILMQCARQADKRKCTLTREEIVQKVTELCPNVVEIDVLPLEELRKHYSMRDDSDLEILYTADVLDADIVITGDNDFFDEKNPPKGVKVRFMRPREYLQEGDE